MHRAAGPRGEARAESRPPFHSPNHVPWPTAESIQSEEGLSKVFTGYLSYGPAAGLAARAMSCQWQKPRGMGETGSDSDTPHRGGKVQWQGPR